MAKAGGEQEKEMSKDGTAGKEAIERFLASAQKTREAARTAAKDMWQKTMVRTKVVRSRFPTGTLNRKQSIIFARTGSNASRLLDMDEEPIYDSLHELWNENVFDLPVCKDLYRLVRRICVVNHDEDVLFMPPGMKMPPRSKPRAPREKSSNDSVELSLESDDEATQATSEDGSLEDEGAAAVEEEILRRSSRLDRWSILKKRKSQANKDDLGSNAAIVKLIVDLISVLANEFETPEACAEIETKLQELRGNVAESEDMQPFVRDIVNMLGEDSRVVRVLKCIHQNVVLHGMAELKTKLMMKYQTKDIRSADGWRILITLSKGYVQVGHTRREQSADMFGNTENHWEVEWEVRMTFDDRMENMTAAQLRITRLILAETMEEKLAEELKATLVDGLIVMYCTSESIDGLKGNHE
eukprot:CAMPEP_0184522454 /NCGR_PEP_ID=MMETSP0198_2-20121128/8290_1 /TAXON_ID=1112570 /ORGANISM="Thraustochytrium sp., Strain LLF1b" /LENGTH=412 /DNA_ID=CAMNT_0026913281 /DNA_START=331 /DNA_END=1567 /DNA_ORIENTATION=+